MNKINWKQKLSSRKFWAAIAGAVASFGAAIVVGVIGGVGSICAYIFAEASADVADINANQTVTVEPPNGEESEGDGDV